MRFDLDLGLLVRKGGHKARRMWSRRLERRTELCPFRFWRDGDEKTHAEVAHV